MAQKQLIDSYYKELGRIDGQLLELDARRERLIAKYDAFETRADDAAGLIEAQIAGDRKHSGDKYSGPTDYQEYVLLCNRGVRLACQEKLEEFNNSLNTQRKRLEAERSMLCWALKRAEELM